MGEAAEGAKGPEAVEDDDEEEAEEEVEEEENCPVRGKCSGGTAAWRGCDSRGW